MASPASACVLYLRHFRHAAAEAFATASRRGDSFEAFQVNSKNCTEQSNGTTAWIGECDRLLKRCVAQATRQRGAGDVVASFEQLFDLIDQAGSCEFDIVFFADEGGVWTFGIGWPAVTRAWLECLARYAKIDGSYQQRIEQILERSKLSLGEVSRELARAVRSRGTPRF